MMNLDDWLFRLADNKECEPEEKDDGSVNCKKCNNITCEYWQDYNKTSND